MRRIKYLLIIPLAFLCSCGESKQVLNLDACEKRWSESIEKLRVELLVQSASLFNSSLDLHGFLRKNGVTTPISFFRKGENFQCVYGQQRDKRFHIRFHIRSEQGRFKLLELKQGRIHLFPENKITEKIADSDLTYEDVRMGLGQWRNVTIIGEESIAGQKCHKLRIISHYKTGNYKIIYAWVHVKYGILFQLVGYNAAGKPLKKMVVTDVMKIGKGNYALKGMRIESIDPIANKAISSTFFKCSKPRKPKK